MKKEKEGPRSPQYDRGDFVQVKRPDKKIRIALIHDRSDLSLGNYRGTIIKRGLSSEITILAADIIGKAPDDFKISEAQAKTLGILPRAK